MLEFFREIQFPDTIFLSILKYFFIAHINMFDIYCIYMIMLLRKVIIVNFQTDKQVSMLVNDISNKFLWKWSSWVFQADTRLTVYRPFAIDFSTLFLDLIFFCYIVYENPFFTFFSHIIMLLWHFTALKNQHEKPVSMLVNDRKSRLSKIHISKKKLKKIKILKKCFFLYGFFGRKPGWRFTARLP